MPSNSAKAISNSRPPKPAIRSRRLLAANARLRVIEIICARQYRFYRIAIETIVRIRTASISKFEVRAAKKVPIRRRYNHYRAEIGQTTRNRVDACADGRTRRCFRGIRGALPVEDLPV